MLLGICHPTAELFPSRNDLNLIEKEVTPFCAQFALHRENVIKILFLELREPLILKVDVNNLFPRNSFCNQVLYNFEQQCGLSSPAQSNQNIVGIRFKAIRWTGYNVSILDQFVLIVDNILQQIVVHSSSSLRSCCLLYKTLYHISCSTYKTKKTIFCVTFCRVLYYLYYKF